MDWANETVLEFLKLYQKHRCLWHPKHKLYKNRACKSAAWCDIMRNMGIKCTIPQLKKKKESLMSAYRAYKSKIKRSLTTGATNGVYQPSWYAFIFLGSVYGCNASLDTENDCGENEDSVYENIDETDTKYDKLIKGDISSEKGTLQKESLQDKFEPPIFKETYEFPKLQDTKKIDQALGL